MEFKYRQAIVRGCKFGPLAAVLMVIGVILLMILLFIFAARDIGRSSYSGPDAILLIVELLIFIGVVVLFLILLGLSALAGIRSIQGALADIRDLEDAAIVSGISGAATGASYAITMYILDVIIMIVVWGVIGFFLGSSSEGGALLGLTSIVAIFNFVEITCCSLVYIVMLGAICGGAAALGGAAYAHWKLMIS